MMLAAGAQSSIVLLDRGELAFARMLAAIRGATRSVHLETYAMSATGIGAEFSAALVEAARRGVTVQVVVDGWGTGRAAGRIVAKLRAGGCRAVVYNPLWRGLFGRARRRNHRKMLVVDDRVAFIGGINLVNEFVGAHAWADVAVEIHGAACANLGRRLRHEPQRAPDNGVHVLLSGGGGRRLRRRYLKAVASSRQRILLAQSYFLPDRRLLRSLTAAARRGVAVTLLVPGNSDVPLARATTGLVYRRLLAAGVQIFELGDAVLHAKLGVFDGDRVLVGSFNLDPYSLADLEVLVDARERKLAESGAAWIERHLGAAAPILDARPRGGAFRRLVERLKGELGLWLAHTVGCLMQKR